MAGVRCQHDFGWTIVPDYEQCSLCGTFRSLKPQTQTDYWHEGHSSIWEQAWNVDMHTENGVSKNRFVIERIEVNRGIALEIGCAPGRLLYWLRHAASFCEVVGIEPDVDSHDAIRKIGGHDGLLFSGFFPDVYWLTGSVVRFDYIVALDVFEHSDRPEEFLAECCRLTKPGGQLFLMLPLADDLPPDSRFFAAAEHVYLHSFHNMRIMLESAGFEDVKHDRWAAGHDTVSARKAPDGIPAA